MTVSGAGPLRVGGKVHVQLGPTETVYGTIRDVSKFGVCITYKNGQGQEFTEWFSPDQAPGVTDRYMDRLGTAIRSAT